MERPRRLDYLLVAGFALTLFGVVLAVGGPLTLHEGVLSQTTKAMLADHDWIVPHIGEAPWLERPPLPQWISCAIVSVLGSDEWVLRLAPAFSATITILLTMWLAGSLYGRNLGILSGLILATMYNFTRYATLAEADMFLAPIVAGTLCVFAKLEIFRPAELSNSDSIHFLGKRPWLVFAFFVLLGATNLAKGIVFGTVIALAPIGVFMIWNFSWHRFGRYTWIWGWLAFALVAAAWPIAVLQRYSDAGQLWKYDLFGRLSGHYLEEPRWYYLQSILWVTLPWTFAAIAGLKLTCSQAWRERDLGSRLVWCWAFMPPLVFSLAQGKHHHYMIHFLAPWAIFAAHGTVWFWQRMTELSRRWWAVPAALAITLDVVVVIVGRKLPGPAWLLPSLLFAAPALIMGAWYFGRHANSKVAATGIFTIVFLMFGGGMCYKGLYLHRSIEDTIFLHEVRERVPADGSLLVYVGEDVLEGLRVPYYLDQPLFLLHNLTFIRDDRITGSDVFLVTRYKFLPEVEQYGQAEAMCQCKLSRREESAADRWTLFRVHLRPDLERKSAHVRISPLQAMNREPGPILN